MNVYRCYQEVVRDLVDRVEELEARVKLNCPGCQEREDKIAQMREQIGQRLIDLGQAWDERVTKLEKQLSNLEVKFGWVEAKLKCEHEPICLPSSNGPIPIFAVNIADARKMKVIAPGQQPPIAFAIAMCKKCGLPYVAVNTLEEAQPFEGGPAPVPLVKPGDPVGGTGDL